MPNLKQGKIKTWSVIKKILLIIFLVMISPIAIFGLLFAYPVVGILIMEWVETTRFNLEILPVVSEQITDPKVRFELYSFDDTMMPQFFVEYAPGQEVRFHTVIGSGVNRMVNEAPYMSLEIKSPSTGKICTTVPQAVKNYDFLQDKPGRVTEKLLEIYHNRQLLIDDFVAAQPECFE